MRLSRRVLRFCSFLSRRLETLYRRLRSAYVDPKNNKAQPIELG